MRIEAYSQVMQAYQTKKATPTKPATGSSFRDQLNISSTGKDIQTAKTAVTNSSDIRTELVDSIKSQIADGTYEVSTEAFADKLMQRYEEMR